VGEHLAENAEEKRRIALRCGVPSDKFARFTPEHNRFDIG